MMPFNWRDIAIGVLRVWWRITKPCTVGVRGLIWNEAGELLLVQHSYGDRKWFPPGGGHRGQESPEETLVREIREETGLSVRIQTLVGVYLYTGHYKRDHIYVFSCLIDEGAPRLVGGEIAAVRWFSPDALPDPHMVGLEQILADWRRGVAGFGRIPKHP